MLQGPPVVLRPTEIPTAEVYRHEVPGDRPAAGGDDCLPGGHRQGSHTWNLQSGKGRLIVTSLEGGKGAS